MRIPEQRSGSGSSEPPADESPFTWPVAAVFIVAILAVASLIALAIVRIT